MKIILISAYVLLLASCTVTDSQFSKADELCSNHGGVKWIYGTTFTRSVDVICGDGTTIQNDSLNNRENTND